MEATCVPLVIEQNRGRRVGLWEKVLKINVFDEVTLNALSHWNL